MKKLMISLFSLILIFVQPARSEMQAAKARVDSPVFDFGTVSQGTKVANEFIISNQGNAELHIQRVVPACGCTASSIDQERIPAGGQGKIKVEFDTTGFAGEKIKNIRVYTSDIEHSTILLTMRGIVEPDITVEPRRVFLGEIVKGSGAASQAEITVQISANSKAQILSAKAFSPHIELKTIESTPKHSRYQVHVSPEVPLGELRERIVVSLSGGKNQSINIPIFATVKGPVQLVPNSASFGVIEGRDQIERLVKLENHGAGDLEVTKISSRDPAVTVDLKPVQAGKTYLLKVKVDPSKVTKDLKASIEIATKTLNSGNSGSENLELSVYGVLPPKV